MNQNKQIDGYTVFMNQQLGCGTFARVYKGEVDSDKTPVAIKIIIKSMDNSNEGANKMKYGLQEGLKIFKMCENPNIVKVIDLKEDQKNYFSVCQLCDCALRFILNPHKQIPQKECIKMLTQICNGYYPLAKNGIIHRDLKPDNIMLKDKILKIDGSYFAKRMKSLDQMNETFVGTIQYMAPQIIMAESYSSKCDVWSIGILFYQILHGTTPWIEMNQFKLIKSIQKKPLQIKRKDLSENTVDFIKKCLTVNPKERIGWDKFFLHPIFEGFFDKMEEKSEKVQ